jgi:hypothetical protein
MDAICQGGELVVCRMWRKCVQIFEKLFQIVSRNIRGGTVRCTPCGIACAHKRGREMPSTVSDAIVGSALPIAIADARKARNIRPRRFATRRMRSLEDAQGGDFRARGRFCCCLMPLAEDHVTGYLTARNYPAFCGVNAEIRVRRFRGI